jgi:8-oxo-dGTP diphosphatase
MSRINSVEVVVGLILHNGRILIAQRNENAPFPLQWEFPGGKVENGESHEAALRRELKEELGIEIDNLKLVFTQDHLYSAELMVHLSFYRIGVFAGEIENRIFHQLRWTALEDLTKFDFLEGDRPFVELLSSSNGKQIRR